MCGIAGIFGSGLALDPATWARWVAALAHRGPDDRGMWLQRGGVWQAHDPAGPPTGPCDGVLLHHRLSILDLSAAGRQPFASADGRWLLVYNGEIYNYLELRRELAAAGEHFSTGTDTEVLLTAWRVWGRDCLARLEGMFAFALVDTHERRLWLVRDPFGIKPLWWSTAGDRLAFASEIKGLLPLPWLPRRADAQTLYGYLRYGHSDEDDRSFFADIRQIRPGELAEFDLAAPTTPRLTRWWTTTPDRSFRSIDEAAEALRAEFLRSVTLHMRSDVEVGVLLSGGLDSSAVAMAARRALGPDAPLRSLSYIADEAELSEERWIDIVNAAAALKGHKERPAAADLRGELDALLDAQDEPFGGLSVFVQHRLFAAAARLGLKVMLDGQGADELLAGYPKCQSARLASLLAAGRPAAILRFLANLPPSPGYGRLSALREAPGFLIPPTLQAWPRRAIGRALHPHWMNVAWFERGGAAPVEHLYSPGKAKLRPYLDRMRDRINLPMLLRYEDRNSMAHAIESRVPFLTPALARLAAGLPEEWLIDGDGTTKAVFRRAIADLVPAEVLARRDKIGFRVPQTPWFRALAPWIDGVLDGPVARALPLWRHDALITAWQTLRNDGRGSPESVWRWLNLTLWAERSGVEITAQPA